jgi:hypothetical protein
MAVTPIRSANQGDDLVLGTIIAGWAHTSCTAKQARYLSNIKVDQIFFIVIRFRQLCLMLEFFVMPDDNHIVN